MVRTAAALLVLLAGLLACNGPGATTSFASSSPGPTSTPPDTGTSDASSTAAGSTTDPGGSADSAEPLRDLGTMPDLGPVQPVGCKDKIDFLFMISRAGGMQLFQEQLLASFPGFIATIEDMFPEFDTHIMVGNPDGAWPGDNCQKYACQDYWPTCGPEAEDYDCLNSSDLATECDRTLGAGILFNAGPYATNKLCTLAGGHRYITRDEPDPLAAFECIARVGGYAYTPPLGDATIAALSPYFGVGKCNEGFLRDDALLVITLIMHNYDVDSKTTPADWFKAIEHAKQYDLDAIVMLAVIPQPMTNPNQTCPFDDTPDENPLHDLITRFPHHVEGNTCAPSYAPYFASAAELIAEACDSFIPQ